MEALPLVNVAELVTAVDGEVEDTAAAGAEERMYSGILVTASLAAELKLFT